jgi:hypothetical protein
MLAQIINLLNLNPQTVPSCLCVQINTTQDPGKSFKSSLISGVIFLSRMRLILK